MPGLNFIRNQVIKPLLFATEKVFESYMQEEAQPQQQTEDRDNNNTSNLLPNISSIKHCESDSGQSADKDSIRNRVNELSLSEQDPNNTNSSQYKKRRYR
jgi:hypothetical protein